MYIDHPEGFSFLQQKWSHSLKSRDAQHMHYKTDHRLGFGVVATGLKKLT